MEFVIQYLQLYRSTRHHYERADMLVQSCSWLLVEEVGGEEMDRARINIKVVEAIVERT